MKIVDFTEEYLEKMVAIFVAEYSEIDRVWNINTANIYLRRNIKSNPEYCKVATTDNGVFMGGICCRTDPYYTGTLLFIDSLEVDKQYRKQGVATSLLEHVVATAKNNKIDGIHFLGDGRKGFPKEWYRKLGFVESGWIEYEVIDLDKLKLD